MTGGQPRLSLPRSMRLADPAGFRRAYAGQRRSDLGGLVIYVEPNHGATIRLGISIGRRCGTAAVRNRMKRLLREAFRLEQHALTRAAGSCDFVVVVRPHTVRTLADYRRALAEAAARHGTGSCPQPPQGWQRQSRRSVSHEPRTTPWRASASWAYTEHDGEKRQRPPMVGASQRR